MKVLVLGSKGQLGSCLSDQFDKTNYSIVKTSRNELDIADLADTKRKIIDISPNVVINATAYTAVDEAEDDREVAESINHLAVANIANTCKELDCWLFHVSTDYVFDGSSATPYHENDQTNPQGVYGYTKLKGEQAIQSSDCKHIIIRTSWLFSEYGNNFLKTILRLGTVKDELSIVGDQIGCPTYAQDLAKTLISILSSLDLKETSSEIMHYCGEPVSSWYEFSKAIFLEAKKFGLKTPNMIYPIKTSAYPTPAVRPAYSVLDCSKIRNKYSINCSDWHDGIRKVLHKSYG